MGKSKRKKDRKKCKKKAKRKKKMKERKKWNNLTTEKSSAEKVLNYSALFFLKMCWIIQHFLSSTVHFLALFQHFFSTFSAFLDVIQHLFNTFSALFQHSDKLFSGESMHFPSNEGRETLVWTIFFYFFIMNIFS